MERTGRAAVAELVASFAFVFIGAGAAVTAGFGLDLTGVALAHGLAFAAMVWATAHVSGGVVNPAIAVGLWVAGRMPTARAAALILAQMLGAIAAALLLRFVAPGEAFDAADGGTPALATGIASGRGIVVEAAATFILVFVAFGALADGRARLGGLGGLAVGLAVATGILAFGPYTGAAANPARWLGPALAAGAWRDWFVWLVGPIAGSIVAAVLYSSAFLRDEEPLTP